MMGSTQASNGGNALVGPVARRCADHVRAAVDLLLRPPPVYPREVWPLTAQQASIALGVILAVFLVLLVAIDGPAVQAVTGLPALVTWCFKQITDFGLSGWFLWPLGILFLALAALPAERLTVMSRRVLAAVLVRVGFLFLAIGLPGLVVSVVKRMIGRGRPSLDGALDPFLFHPFIWRADFASMPSGHATTVFSVLVAFGTLWPRARTALWIYALLIVASRVVVLAHFPSDIFVGAVAGTAGALLVRRYFALRRLGFSVGPGGIPHQYPGPSPRRIKVVARELLAL